MDTLEQDWTRLHRESQDAGLFNSWYWGRLWWQHYGYLGELSIMVVRIDNVVQGIAPLYRCKSRALKLVMVDTLRFIGTGGDTSPDDLGLLVNQNHETVVLSTICHELFNQTQCRRLQLYAIVEPSPLATALTLEATKNKWCTPLQRKQQRLVDSLPDSIEAFERKLSKNARKQRRRRRQQLHNTGHVQYSLCESPSDVDDAFAHLLRLHKKRQESKGEESDSFKTTRYCDFHLALMKQALAKNELRLLTLKLDDQVIGIEYAFLSKGVLYFFQTGFDPDYQHLSPGHILMSQTIDQGIEDGATRLDLLMGDYEYKRTYAKQVHTTTALDIWKNPIIQCLSRLIRAVG